MIGAAFQLVPPADGVGTTTAGYGIFALVVVALVISVFVAALVSVAFFAIRHGGRHRGSHP